MDSIIELDDVKKTYYLKGGVDVPVLHGINLDVKKGDFLAIKGPSGSGKSTAMNMIGSLDIPSSGNIFLDGKDIAQMSESDLAGLRGRKVGFIFQNFNLISTLSALDNVALPSMFQGKDRRAGRQRAKELLEKVGLGHRLNHKPTELSGGENQRVAIARALINDPEVILADEPTGNLDSKTGKEIISILKELNNDGKTVIMITHNDKLAREAKHIVNLKDGRISK